MFRTLPRLARLMLLLLVATACAAAPAAAAPAPGATTLAAGAEHTCVARTDGTVACWGSNTHSQLGNGANPDDADITPQPSPVTVSGLSVASDPGQKLDQVTAVAAGVRHSCAVRSSGEVACWGYDDQGQLGDGGSIESDGRAASPVAVTGLSDAVAVSAGAEHTCAVRSTGGVVCWGSRGSGRLGDLRLDGNDPSASPVEVRSLSDAVSVSAGGSHSCAVRRTGAVVCWGSNVDGQLGAGQSGAGQQVAVPIIVAGVSNAVSVFAGATSTCATTHAGAVYCWGTAPGASSPTTATKIPGVDDAAGVSLGDGHACAAQRSGAVVCWGQGSLGQLGDGRDGPGLSSATPVAATGISAAAAVSSGGRHSCAVLTNNTVTCWGDGASGQLGSGVGHASTAVAVRNLTGATSIAGTGAHTCAVTGSGVTCWGNNSEAQLATGDHQARVQPATVAGTAGYTAVAGGLGHSCGLQSGNVFCWGWAEYGQLGNGQSGSAAQDVLSPLQVSGLTGVNSLAASAVHTCALRADSTVACWGANFTGQLGNGLPGLTPVSSPAAVPGVSNVVGISAGIGHTCVARGDDTAVCWGDNADGQLGLNPASYPINANAATVPGLTNVEAIAAGSAHSCALITGGAIRCWGANFTGQLGDGSTTSSFTPVTVSGISDAVAVAAGGETTCALRAGGTVSCWGLNDDLQAGAIGDDFTLTPITVTGVSGATAIAVGSQHACALRAGGTVSCWGSAEDGRLGDGPMPGGHGPWQPTAAPVAAITNALLPTPPNAPVIPAGPTPTPTPDPAPPADEGGGPAPTPGPIAAEVKPPTLSAAKQVSRAQASKQLRFRLTGGKPGSAYNGVLKIGNRGGKAAGKLDKTGSALILLKLPKAQLKKVKKGTKLTLAINVVGLDGKVTKLTRVITVK